MIQDRKSILFKVLIPIVFILTTLLHGCSGVYTKNHKNHFNDRNDSLHWLEFMKCAVSGDRAFSREEKLIISKILEEGLRTEKGAKVLVTPTDLNGISDVNKRWYGVIDKSHCGVYFTVSDSLGIKSEHHIFEIEFLERDTMNITPGVKTISD